VFDSYGVLGVTCRYGVEENSKNVATGLTKPVESQIV